MLFDAEDPLVGELEQAVYGMDTTARSTPSLL
jgi:hypothetical protein